MKIALLGKGKMGKLLQTLAEAQGITVTTAGCAQELDLEGVDVCIDFSHASQVVPIVKRCCECRIPIVIGTTAWEQDFDVVADAVESAGIGCVYSSNYSVGIFLMEHLLKSLSVFLKQVSQPQFDVAIHEMHHSKKVDAPSGTALQLAKKLGENEIPITSTRCGFVIGTHTVLVDGIDDTLELTHRAKSRNSFAQGALLAAQWVRGRKGMYTFEELLRSQYGM